MECAFYIYLFPMQSVLWVSIYVYRRRKRRKRRRDVVHCKRSSLVLNSISTHQYNASENDACARIYVWLFSAWNCQFKDDDLEYCLYHVVLFKVLGLECSGFRVLWMNKTAENWAWILDIVKREFESDLEWKNLLSDIVYSFAIGI